MTRSSRDMDTDGDFAMESVECTQSELQNVGTVNNEEAMSSDSLQALRPASSSSVVKQIAIAPKPVGVIGKNFVTTVKKISVSNIRGKTPSVTDSAGRQLVVVPTTDGKIKVIGTGSVTSQMSSPQVVRTADGHLLQLRQTTVPPLTKIAIVQNNDTNTTTPKPATRYISLQQAQQLGLVSSGKVHQLVSLAPVKQVALASNQTNKPIMRQTLTTIKSPTKILPAPAKGVVSAGKMLLTTIPQNIAVKTNDSAKPIQVVKSESISGASGSTILATLSPNQKLSTQQINVAGKGVEIVRLVTIPNASQQQKSTLGQVRIAPMTSSATRPLQTNAKVVQAKSPQMLTKPLLLDVHGNIVQISPTDGQNTNSSNAGITLKKVITNSQTKLIPVAVNIPSSTMNVQTLSNDFLASNLSPIKIKSFNKNQLDNLQENGNIAVNKTELIEEEIINNNENEDEEMDEEQSQITKTSTVTSPFNNIGQSDMKHIVMLPASYIQQLHGQNVVPKSLSVSAPSEIKHEIDMKNIDCSFELGMRPRKPCNCTKSQCLKLYCDCFANGEFCNQCNCNNCYNNLRNEEFRQKAIRTCLERNPNAFRPKIGRAKNYGPDMIRRHNKGCNCKRSGCLKNYCECYEGKIACSANCKCIGCRNIEDTLDKRSIKKVRADFILGQNNKVDESDQYKEFIPCVGKEEILKKDTMNKSKKPWSYMTTDVIEAVCNCLIAQASESEACEDSNTRNATKYILEEFARCLQDMISTAQLCSSPITSDDGRGVTS